MASGFSTAISAEGACEEAGCDANTDVTFCVKEQRKLCHDCASKKECIGIARRGGPNLFCEKHDKLMDLYCKSHGVTLCVSCAMIDHRQQQCEQQDIEDALLENKAALSGLKDMAIDNVKSYQDCGNEIRLTRQTADEHLQTVKNKVDSEVQTAIERDVIREREDAEKIDQEIDGKNQILQEEIRKIQIRIQMNNEEREKRHEENWSNAKMRQAPILDKQRNLHVEIQNIAQEIERKFIELEKPWQDGMKSSEKAKETLETVLENDRMVLKDGHRLKASVSMELNLLKKQLNGSELEDINHAVSGVRFVKGAGKQKYDGKIDFYNGEWKLIDTINVEGITSPVIVGLIDDHQVIVRERLWGSFTGDHTCIFDLATRSKQRVVNESNTSLIWSCSLLKRDKIVCGKYIERCREKVFPGCIGIGLYDRQCNHINDVTIPRNTTDDEVWVSVAADQGGMVIAAEAGQSQIYIINPAEGKIINTITCKEAIRMYGTLTSGHIVARPSPPDRRVLIIDRDGGHREILHDDFILNVCVDHLTDALYVVTVNEHKTCMIDQVMSEGDVNKIRIASFPLSTKMSGLYPVYDYLARSLIMMTSSGCMVSGDGDNILVFKNIFSLK